MGQEILLLPGHLCTFSLSSSPCVWPIFRHFSIDSTSTVLPFPPPMPVPALLSAQDAHPSPYWSNLSHVITLSLKATSSRKSALNTFSQIQLHRLLHSTHRVQSFSYYSSQFPPFFSPQPHCLTRQQTPQQPSLYHPFFDQQPHVQGVRSRCSINAE